ncbi:MAG TPA: glycosyltransferase family 9 protein [Thermoanaerobaculia bacterium]|nr:glycosyltransferase family 9 protein [Thermoanaerobaculia bacterium]
MKLLAIRLSAFGDVIHTIPAVVALRDLGHDVVWVVERPYRDLVALVARVDTISVSMKEWGRAFVASRGEMFAARAAMRGFDAAIDFQGLIKSASLAWVSRARLRYGFGRGAIREGAAGVFLNRRVDVDRERHVVEWNLELARAVDRNVGEAPNADFSHYAEDPSGKLRDLKGRVVLLPGAGRPEKQWDKFPELANRIGPEALVAWGPGEHDLATSIGADVAPQTSLRELAFLLKNAKLVVGGDTGPLHLAAALGTPVVGIYGPTNPLRNGPYRQLDRVVESWSTTKSMDTINVDAVFNKL